MKYPFIWLIRFYRRFLSPLKRCPCCRFTPSCSAYALEAFEKRGFFVGLPLAIWRILRCNPFGRGGYDPVPEHGFRVPRAAFDAQPPQVPLSRRESGTPVAPSEQGKEHNP